MAWFKIGALAVLWAIIAVAATSGWLIGRSDAARQISALQQRLALQSGDKPGCGVQLELLEARTGSALAATNPFGVTLRGFLPRPPQHLHLREMLTSR
jgi:hypothetical protein